MSDGEYIAACVADLREVLDQAGGDVAALIAEPIQGVGGFTSGPDGLLAAFKRVLDRHGILWITDEVQTGWGRTGDHFWGWQAHAESGPPDILTFAKGIGNGLSMGGVVARAEVMNSLTANSISTFGGSPITTAGALANLTYLIDHDLQGNARRVGGLLRSRLEAIAAALPVVTEVRGRGLMLGIELAEPAAANLVLEAARAGGLLVGKGGRAGDALRIAPPLSLTIAEAEEGAAILEDALKQAQSQLDSAGSRGGAA
jgi:4-aminobutyrate aminotransferase